MDVEDITAIFEMILEDGTNKNTIINISYKNAITIPEVVMIFEKELNKKAKISLVENGNNYSIPNDYFNSLYMRVKGVNVTNHYTLNCFKKYIELKNNI
jgi:nucleoside-diphosphate-sugar epimerase